MELAASVRRTLTGFVLAAATIVVGASRTFTWPARVATGALILAGAAWARRAPVREQRGLTWQQVGAALVVFAVFAVVELVDLAHTDRARWPTLSSLLERVANGAVWGPFLPGRVLLVLAWEALGWWLFARS